jgi:hypothetical protein
MKPGDADDVALVVKMLKACADDPMETAHTRIERADEKGDAEDVAFWRRVISILEAEAA